MTLAFDARLAATEALARATFAVLEVCLVVAVSLAMTAWVPGLDPWRTCAAVALIYYPLNKIVPRGGFADIWSGFQSLRKLPKQVAATDGREALHIVTRTSPQTPMESSEDFASAAPPVRSASR